MSDSRVSVIVPTFNRAPLLVECVESLLRQTVPPLEVIVIDDGSTDETAQVAGRFPAPVRVLHKDNGGKPSALNLALPQARGDWIWFFDDDDVALPRSIELRLAAAAEAPGCDLVVSRFIWGTTGTDGRIVAGEALQWPRFGATDFYPQFLRSCFAHLNGVLVRRPRALEAGPFRSELLTSEDYDFTLRIARGAHVALCDAPTFVFRQHAGARGPANQRYSAAERLRKFADGDAAIGRWIRATHRLPEYLGLRAEAPLDGAARRSALLARLQVMAGKGLLDEVAADAKALSDDVEASGAPLEGAEIAALKGALQERYLAFHLAENVAATARKFEALRSSRTGRSMLRVMSRAALGLAWWRAKGIVERARFAHLGLRLRRLAVAA